MTGDTKLLFDEFPRPWSRGASTSDAEYFRNQLNQLRFLIRFAQVFIDADVARTLAMLFSGRIFGGAGLVDGRGGLHYREEKKLVGPISGVCCSRSSVRRWRHVVVARDRTERWDSRKQRGSSNELNPASAPHTVTDPGWQNCAVSRSGCRSRKTRPPTLYPTTRQRSGRRGSPVEGCRRANAVA